MHEVIVLQFGQQANYLGTHYWNTQESYFTYDDTTESPMDHDRSFRQGIGVDGADTYTPRALVYDLKNAFGSLRRDNELYSNPQEAEDLLRNNVWGQTSTIRLPTITQSAYQDALNSGSHADPLDPSTVRYWSDYNHVFYHPRSMIQLSDYEVNSTLMPFERYETGEALFDSLDTEHDILDRDLRPFLEDCDQLQAINLVASTTDAWGGFAAKYAERISDDLGKGCRWFFGLEDNSVAGRAQQSMRVGNVVQCIDALASNVSLNLPLKTLLTSPLLAINMRHPWQTSALQAMALESLTLPSRLKQTTPGSATAHDMEQVINLDGHRTLVAMGMDLSEGQVADGQSAEQDHRMVNGLSHTEEEEEVVEKMLDLDFFPSHSSQHRRVPAARQHNRLFARMAVDRQTHRTHFEAGLEADVAGKSIVSRTALPFPILSSYPKDVLTQCEDNKLQALVSASSSERVAWYIRDCAAASRLALPLELREELYDGLINMAEEYEASMSFSDFEELDDD